MVLPWCCQSELTVCILLMHGFWIYLLQLIFFYLNLLLLMTLDLAPVMGPPGRLLLLSWCLLWRRHFAANKRDVVFVLYFLPHGSSCDRDELGDTGTSLPRSVCLSHIHLISLDGQKLLLQLHQHPSEIIKCPSSWCCLPRPGAGSFCWTARAVAALPLACPAECGTSAPVGTVGCRERNGWEMSMSACSLRS